MQIQQMRAFIIRTVYYLLWAAILLALLKWVLPAAASFVIGFGLAALLRPVVRLFGRYCAANEKALAVFVMVLFYLTIGLAAVLLALRCALWVQQALVYLPDFYDQALRPGLEQLRQAVQRLADRLTPMLAPFVSDAGRQLSDSLQRVVSSLSDRAMDSLAGMAGGVPGFLLESGLCILSSFFFAADYPAVTRFLLGRMPPHWRQTALEAKKKHVHLAADGPGLSAAAVHHLGRGVAGSGFAASSPPFRHGGDYSGGGPSSCAGQRRSAGALGHRPAAAGALSPGLWHFGAVRGHHRAAGNHRAQAGGRSAGTASWRLWPACSSAARCWDSGDCLPGRCW